MGARLCTSCSAIYMGKYAASKLGNRIHQSICGPQVKLMHMPTILEFGAHWGHLGGARCTTLLAFD